MDEDDDSAAVGVGAESLIFPSFLTELVTASDLVALTLQKANLPPDNVMQMLKEDR